MGKQLERVGASFWNIRGSFRILGLLDVGTHSSLVRLDSGRYVLLDCCQLEGEVAESVNEVTENGSLLESIVNLHPFHTVYVARVAAMFPEAKLYGTVRHHERLPDLPWQKERTETSDFARLYEHEFEFLVPQGVDFVPSNEQLHFASVIAIHRPSRAMHVDDTLNYFPIPFVKPRLSFHPTLGSVLQARSDAVRDFRAWAESLIEACEQVDRVCIAHLKSPPADSMKSVASEVRAALGRAGRTLDRHEARFRT